MSARLDALAASLQQPLLVTDLVNIAYLTGFDSSNAALLVRPGGEATLYTDFRYIDSAREVSGVEATLTKRSLLVELAGVLKGTVQFESAALPYSEWQNLSAGKAKLVPTTGIVERLIGRPAKPEATRLAFCSVTISARSVAALTTADGG